MSINSTDHLGDFIVDATGAATTALKEGVKAETSYSVERVKAQRDYNVALAAANVISATKTAEVRVAEYLGNVIPHVPASFVPDANWTPQMLVQKRIEAALAAIEAEHQGVEKTERGVFAGKVGDASVARATELGTALVGEASAQGDASIGLAIASKTDQTGYEAQVTLQATAAATAAGTHATTRSNRAVELRRDLTAALGAAGVARQTALGAGETAQATSVATAEGAYWSAQKIPTSEPLRHRARKQFQHQPDWIPSSPGECPVATVAAGKDDKHFAARKDSGCARLPVLLSHCRRAVTSYCGRARPGKGSRGPPDHTNLIQRVFWSSAWGPLQSNDTCAWQLPAKSRFQTEPNTS